MQVGSSRSNEALQVEAAVHVERVRGAGAHRLGELGDDATLRSARR